MKKILLAVTLAASIILLCTAKNFVNADSLNADDFIKNYKSSIGELKYSETLWDEKTQGTYDSTTDYGQCQVKYVVLKLKEEAIDDNSHNYYFVYQYAEISLLDKYKEPQMGGVGSKYYGHVYLNKKIELKCDVDEMIDSQRIAGYGPEATFKKVVISNSTSETVNIKYDKSMGSDIEVDENGNITGKVSEKIQYGIGFSSTKASSTQETTDGRTVIDYTKTAEPSENINEAQIVNTLFKYDCDSNGNKYPDQSEVALVDNLVQTQRESQYFIVRCEKDSALQLNLNVGIEQIHYDLRCAAAFWGWSGMQYIKNGSTTHQIYAD